MTPESVCDFAARCTYKPGWVFIVEQYDDGAAVAITARGPALDAITNETATTSGQRAWSALALPSYTPAMLAREVLGLIGDIEQHEVSEWFRVDGLHVIEPHPEAREWCACGVGHG